MLEHNIIPVHNPVSNLKLASGVAPIRAMLAAGVKPALGTDGNGSNNNLDMFRELFTASLLQKGFSLDAQALDAYTAVKMATVYGADALEYRAGMCAIILSTAACWLRKGNAFRLIRSA